MYLRRRSSGTAEPQRNSADHAATNEGDRAGEGKYYPFLHIGFQETQKAAGEPSPAANLTSIPKPYRHTTVQLLLPADSDDEIELHEWQLAIVPPETWVFAALWIQTPMSEQAVAFTRVIVQSWLVETLK